MAFIQTNTHHKSLINDREFYIRIFSDAHTNDNRSKLNDGIISSDLTFHFHSKAARKDIVVAILDKYKQASSSETDHYWHYIDAKVLSTNLFYV